MMNLKFALRLLLKTPFVTSVAIASLALGIGANAAIFSLVNQLMLRPLPVHNPGELVNFADPGPNPGSQSCSGIGGCDEVFSYPMFRDLQREQKSFTGIAAHVDFGANLATRGQTISGNGMLVSGSYFPILGLRPALGRLLDGNDDRVVGEAHVAVLSYEYWARNFGSDPAALNQTLIVNGETMTIVGVAPRGFTGTSVSTRPQVFVPITMRLLMRHGADSLDNRRSYWAYLFGRLKPGVSRAQAASAINVPYHAILGNVEAPLQKEMSAKTMSRFRDKRIVLASGLRGQSQMSKQVATPLLLLMSVTAFVLLIACANIANLLLARGASRAGEMAVRLSIGGSRVQLITQLMVESCILGLVGGALSLAVARVTLGTMSSLLPEGPAGVFDVHLDWTVVGFTALLSLLTALAFGLFPALSATRPDLIATLRASSGQPSGGRTAARWRTALATGQIALSMGLLGSAGLFTKSLANISRTELGVKIDHVFTFALSPELNGYKPAKALQIIQQTEDALARMPGVTGVTAATVPLIGGSNWGNSVDVEGFPSGPDVDNNSRFNEIGATYFSTLGVPLIAGREFTRADGLGAAKVAIVNQAFARKFKLGSNVVGRRIDQGNKKLDIEIVGLTKDAKYSAVKDSTPPIFFIPYAQDDGVGYANFYVRTTQPPELMLRSIPKLVLVIDPTLPVESLRTMPDQVRDNVFLDRFISIFSATFAVLATLLAAIGLYGVLAYTVAQRTREIGVRMALGAAPGAVRGMVLWQVGKMVLVGGTIGVVAAIGFGRIARSILYQLQGYDPLVLGGAVLTLAVVALAAGFVPAYRAARIEPIQALRHE